MIDKRVESVDEYLNREVFGTKKEKPVKIKKLKNKKRLIVSAVAIILAITTAVTCMIHFGRKKKQNGSDLLPTKTISTLSLDEMGSELEFPDESKLDQPRYGEVVSGDININEIVEGKDPKTNKTILWKNQEAKEKSKDIGKTVIDTKNGTLVVTQNGTVKEKTEGYEVKDTTGKVVASGEGNVPQGKVWDNDQNAYVDSSEAGKYVYADTNYYDKTTGELILEKGMLVTKETLENAKRVLSTSNTASNYNSYENNSYNTQSYSAYESNTSYNQTYTEPVYTPVQEETKQVSSDEGRVNSNGTYTIYGMTFQSKADYQQWVIQGYNGYSEVDGMMMSDAKREAYQKTLR